MIRHVDMNEISDGKLYDLNDMVKVGCNDCKGCSACCRRMGNSILLDPLDIARMCENLGCTIETLLNDKIELGMEDGIILPHLKLSGAEEKCGFLNEEGRCSIHSFRPGICRLFPLGRYYENGSFRYFLQVHECPEANKTKVKVKKWIDTPDIAKNTQFICKWHELIRGVQTSAQSISPEMLRQKNLYILNNFFMCKWNLETFYEDFEAKLEEASEFLS